MLLSPILGGPQFKPLAYIVHINALVTVICRLYIENYDLIVVNPSRANTILDIIFALNLLVIFIMVFFVSILGYPIFK